MKLYTHISHGFYRHSVAPINRVNAGSEGLAFEPAFGLPLEVHIGPATMAGQFDATMRPVLSMHPIGSPQGLPQQSAFGAPNVMQFPTNLGE